MLTRAKFAGLALTLSLLVPVWFLVSALGVKFGLWSWRLGLGVLIIQWGPRLLLATAVIALVALIVVLVRRPRAAWTAALVALIIPATGLGYLGWVRAQAADIPPIHDVATDIADPPAPSPGLLSIRKAAEANPVADLRAPLIAADPYRDPRFAKYGRKSLGQVGHDAYPGLRTAAFDEVPTTAFTAALKAAQGMGWTVVTQDPQAGVIEATAGTFWFGFKDDVVVRVRPGAGGQGSSIDVRSISRVGLSDLGANAKRIETYLARVSAGLKT